jgi:hypothetical protein
MYFIIQEDVENYAPQRWQYETVGFSERVRIHQGKS